MPVAEKDSEKKEQRYCLQTYIFQANQTNPHASGK